jgi:hypothetical protein
MKKGLIIKIVVVLAVVGVGAYLLLKGGVVNFTGNGVSITAQTFTGSIKDAVKKGIPLKCTMPKNETTGIEVVVGYLKGEKYYAEINQKGKAGYIIIADNCMYSWFKSDKQGAKICFSGNVWDQQGSEDTNYNCKTAAFSDSIFTPPSDVKFMDIGSQ